MTIKLLFLASVLGVVANIGAMKENQPQTFTKKKITTLGNGKYYFTDDDILVLEYSQDQNVATSKTDKSYLEMSIPSDNDKIKKYNHCHSSGKFTVCDQKGECEKLGKLLKQLTNKP